MKTTIHLSAKIKLIGLIAASTAAIFIKDLMINSLLILLVIFLLRITKPKGNALDRFSPLLFIGFLVLLFQLGFNTTVSIETRFLIGLIAAERIITLSLLVFIFTSTTSPAEIASLFSFLPAKFQLMIVITLAMIPAIIEESGKITLNQTSRGLSRGGLNPLRSILPIIIPLLHRTLRRAEQIAVVMQARGYEEK